MHFHCDITDDIRTFAHNTQHHPEHMRESAAKVVNLKQVIVIKMYEETSHLKQMMKMI